MAKIFWNGQWIPEGYGNTYSLNWEETATPNYEAQQRRFFSGPEDPVTDGQTVMPGDIWFDPEEGVTATRAAGDVTFSDSGLTVITGVSNVQAALNKVDDKLAQFKGMQWLDATGAGLSAISAETVLSTIVIPAQPGPYVYVPSVSVYTQWSAVGTSHSWRLRIRETNVSGALVFESLFSSGSSESNCLAPARGILVSDGASKTIVSTIVRTAGTNTVTTFADTLSNKTGVAIYPVVT